MKALVCGTAGLQITIPIGSFPYEYKSVYFMDDKVATDIAGVGYSSTLILKTLGSDVTFLTGIGNDELADIVKKKIEDSGAKCLYEVKDKESLVSVILYDDHGNRSILREGRMDYKYKMNPDVYMNIEDDYDVAMFSLTGFSRDILPIVKGKGIPIVCDMQTVDNLFNDYGREFMDYSDIIFFSNDHYEGNLEQLVRELYQKHNFRVIGVGMGSEGCLLCVDGVIQYYNAWESSVVNTVGAGDTLFSSFVHFYYNGDLAEEAIRKALAYVSKKIEHRTASEGFMSLAEFEAFYSQK